MQRAWHIIRREPLVAFIILGAALYALMVAVRPSDQTETIEVSGETVRALVRTQEELVGRKLSPEEVRTIVEGHLDDEVLLREARRQGFDENDLRVRKRLLSVMRTTLDEPVPAPSVAQLQAYYRDSTDRFQSPPAVSLEQVAFPWGSEKTPEDAAAFMEKLQGHAEPLSLGETSLVGSRLNRVSRSRLVLLFGSDFANVVFDLTPDTWSGPLESKSGVHYVRVIERYPAETVPFEKMEPYLRQQWEFDKRREIQQKKIDKLREQYRIVLPEEFRADSE
jgi:hypothetical protein